MDSLPTPLLLAILERCQAGKDDPLYPTPFAEELQLDRTLLDRCLDRLRMAGWIQLTEWIPGRGQGYAITDAGLAALANPRIELLLEQAESIRPQNLTQRHPHHSEDASTRGEQIRASLSNPTRPYVTYTLIALCVLNFLAGAYLARQRNIPVNAFIVMQGKDAQANAVQLMRLQDDLGAISPGDVFVLNEWWRLLSYCFVHAGILHLGMNMFFLFVIGGRLEVIWGPVRYLYLYLVSGIVGGITVIYYNSAAVGASGALCGLLTSLLVWVWINRRFLNETFVNSMIRALLSNVLIMVFISMMPGISAAGHFGGGLAGLLLSFPLNLNRYGQIGTKLLGLAGIVLIPVLFMAALFILRADRFAEGARQREVYQIAKISQAAGEVARVNFNLIVELDRPTLQKNTAAEIAETRASLLQAAGELRAVNQQFSAKKVDNADVTAHLKAAQQYFESSAKLFDAVAAALDHPPPITDRENATILTLAHETNTLRDRWRQSK